MGKLFGIENKWLIIILIAALIEPFHYFLLIHYPPEGKTFMAYDSDEALVAGIMRSVELGFDNPWSVGEKVFFNGALTSPYAYIPFGFVRLLLGIDALLMNIIAKFILFSIFLAVLFKFMETIIPQKHKLAFVFFLVPLGLMPVGYLMGTLSGIERFAEGFSFEFSILNNISRVYYFIPLITGLLSTIMFVRNKNILSSILLGFTFLFYPFFGFAFLGILGVYILSLKGDGLFTKIKQTVKDVWKIALAGAVFLLPWLYIRLAHSQYFSLYGQNSLWWRAHVLSLIGSYFFLIVIILICNRQRLRKHTKLLTVITIASVVIIINELIILSVPPFASIILNQTIVDIFDILFTLSFVTAFYFVLKSNVDKKEKFLLLFAILLVVLSTLNPKYLFWMQYRMGYLLHIPLAMLAAFYFDNFLNKARSIRISKNVVFAILIIFAVSSFAAYNYRFQMADRIIGQTYFNQSDKDAMLFLDGQPKGLVMASDDTNYFLPTWSGHYVLYHPAESQYMGGGPNRTQKKVDVNSFYSDISESNAKSIVEKYNIDYVFYGSKEKALGNDEIDSYPFLEKIYDGESKVYRVIS